jgi:hypothetical protein
MVLLSIHSLVLITTLTLKLFLVSYEFFIVVELSTLSVIFITPITLNKLLSLFFPLFV